MDGPSAIAQRLKHDQPAEADVPQSVLPDLRDLVDSYASIAWGLFAIFVIACVVFAVTWFFLARPKNPRTGKPRLPVVFQILLAMLITGVFTFGLCLSLFA